MGNFDFGHNANNPLSTGNGYANMLLGVFTTYTELTSRVDRDVRHWQNDFYIQDNWRVTPRLTIDYGLRIQHSGSDFEVNNMNSGFFADQWSRSQARARLPAGLHGWPSRQPGVRRRTCSGRSTRPTPTCSSRPRSTATSFQGSGSQINGITTGGIPGRKPGTYFTFPYFTYAPRAGFAWNMFGDGKTALRGSWGIFYNFPRIDRRRRRLSLLGRLPGLLHSGRSAGRRSTTSRPRRPSNLVENPVNVNIGGLRTAAREIAQRQHRVPARHRLQHRGRDRLRRQLHAGTRPNGRCQPPAALRVRQSGQPGEQRAGQRQLAADRCMGRIPAWARSRSSFPDLYSETLRYNALQLQVQRRLSQGPADGPGVHARQGRRATRATIPTPTRSVARRRSGRATGDRRPTTAGTTS